MEIEKLYLYVKTNCIFSLHVVRAIAKYHKGFNFGKISLNSSEREKQPSMDGLMKRYSENMQQIYRRTPVPKCDFNKIAL